MKKVFISLLIFSAMLFATSCNEAPLTKQYTTTPGTTQPVTEETAPQELFYKIGDTAEGELFSITLKSFEYMDTIKNGRTHVYGYIENPTLFKEVCDLTALDGYTFIKMVVVIDYKGKQKTTLPLRNIKLDYDDGYIFDTDSFRQQQHDNCYSNDTHNVINLDEIKITDPLAFKPKETTIYMTVNKEVQTNTDKPLVLKVSVPTGTGTETLQFDIREK